MNDDTYTLKPISKAEAEGDPIVLSQNASYLVEFTPYINQTANGFKVYGRIRKTFKGNISTHQQSLRPITDLGAGESFTLILSADEIERLNRGVDDIRIYLQHNGMPNEIVSFSRSALRAKALIQELSSLASSEETLDIDVDDRDLFSATNYLNAVFLHQTIDKLEDALEEGHSELWWQKQFVAASWVLGQLYNQPVVLMRDQAYVGGKSIDNKDGMLADFILKNNFTDNISLVEIKTPDTPILQSAAYRKNTVYGLSSELDGAITQVLTQRNELYKNYYMLSSSVQYSFEVFDPKCLVIAGRTSTLNTVPRRRSFELRRQSLKDVELITFDEVIMKCRTVLNLINENL